MQMAGLHSFLWPSNIPPYTYTTSWSIRPPMATGAASGEGRLRSWPPKVKWLWHRYWSHTLVNSIPSSTSYPCVILGRWLKPSLCLASSSLPQRKQWYQSHKTVERSESDLQCLEEGLASAKLARWVSWDHHHYTTAMAAMFSPISPVPTTIPVIFQFSLVKDPDFSMGTRSCE